MAGTTAFDAVQIALSRPRMEERSERSLSFAVLSALLERSVYTCEFLNYVIYLRDHLRCRSDLRK